MSSFHRLFLFLMLSALATEYATAISNEFDRRIKRPPLGGAHIAGIVQTKRILEAHIHNALTRLRPPPPPSATIPVTENQPSASGPQKPIRVPPYAVKMEPMIHYSQKDPLFVEKDPLFVQKDPLFVQKDSHYQNITSIENNSIGRSSKVDHSVESSNSVFSYSSQYAPSRGQYYPAPAYSFPVYQAGGHGHFTHSIPHYYKEPEPIIEIIVKESNESLPAPPSPIWPQPIPSIKEPIQVFYVKYKKNPTPHGKEEVVYEDPIPALNPVATSIVENTPTYDHTVAYHEPLTPAFPPSTTTLRTIIHPDSETYHGSGLKVTFGKTEEIHPGHRTTGHDFHHDLAEEKSSSVENVKRDAKSKKSEDQKDVLKDKKDISVSEHHFIQERQTSPFQNPPPRSANQEQNGYQPENNFDQSQNNFGQKREGEQKDKILFPGPQPVPFRPQTSFSIRAQKPDFDTYSRDQQTRQQFPQQVQQSQPQRQVQQPQFLNQRGSFQGPQQPQNSQGNNNPSKQFDQPPYLQPILTSIPPTNPSQNGRFSGQPNNQKLPQTENNRPDFHRFNSPQSNFNQSPQNPLVLAPQFVDGQLQNQRPQQFNQYQNQASRLPQERPNQNQIPSHLLEQRPSQNQFLQDKPLQHIPPFLVEKPIVQNQALPIFQEGRPVQNQQEFAQTRPVQQQNQFVQSKPPLQQGDQFVQRGPIQTQQRGQFVQERPNEAPSPQFSQISVDQKDNQQLRYRLQFLQEQEQQLLREQMYLQEQRLKQQQLQNGDRNLNQPQNQLTQEQIYRIIAQQQQQQQQQQSASAQKNNLRSGSPQNLNQNFRLQASPSNFEKGPSLSQSDEQDILRQLAQQQNIRNSSQNGALSSKNQISISNQLLTLSNQQFSTPNPNGQTAAGSNREGKSEDASLKEKSKSSGDKIPPSQLAKLPDEVPEDLREQLLSSGILSNADIHVLDYDKVGDIPIESLPPEALESLYGAGSDPVGTVALPPQNRRNAVNNAKDNVAGDLNASKVEMKVVRYDPSSLAGGNIEKSYLSAKDGSQATTIDPVVLNDSNYNRYLPLKVNGAKFPLPADNPLINGKRISSVVILAPIDYDFVEDPPIKGNRKSKAPKVHGVRFVSGESLKNLVQNPSEENFRKWLSKERATPVNGQSVILLVANNSNEKEIFMYDLEASNIKKLEGNLSSAFVNVAETNAQSEDLNHLSDTEENAAEASESSLPVTGIMSEYFKKKTRRNTEQNRKNLKKSANPK